MEILQIIISFYIFSYKKQNGMSYTTNLENAIVWEYGSGTSIGALSYISLDFDDIDNLIISLTSGSHSYNNYQTARFCPFVYISDTSDWTTDADAETDLGQLTKITSDNTTVNITYDCSSITGTKYLCYNSSGCDSSLKIMISGEAVSDTVLNTYIKVNGVWQALIGTDADLVR